jgi:hypothetical protein
VPILGSLPVFLALTGGTYCRFAAGQ